MYWSIKYLTLPLSAYKVYHPGHRSASIHIFHPYACASTQASALATLSAHKLDDKVNDNNQYILQRIELRNTFDCRRYHAIAITYIVPALNNTRGFGRPGTVPVERYMWLSIAHH